MVSTQAFCTFLSNSTLAKELFLARDIAGSGGVGDTRACGSGRRGSYGKEEVGHGGVRESQCGYIQTVFFLFNFSCFKLLNTCLHI